LKKISLSPKGCC